MTSVELRLIIAKTGLERPSDQCDCGREQQPHEWSVECVASELDWSADLVEKHIRDRSPAMVVAEHADALVALAESCERLREWRDGDQRTGADLDARLDEMMSALSAVHAVKESP